MYSLALNEELKVIGNLKLVENTLSLLIFSSIYSNYII
jgi:hypothetical protein